MPIFDLTELPALRERARNDEDRWHRLSPLFGEELNPTTFGRTWNDYAADPEDGLAILEALAALLGTRGDVSIEGDLVIPRDHEGPLVVHGDLRVSGGVVAYRGLLVTGSVFADSLLTDYDDKVGILGDVHARAVATDGALYVGGEVWASELVWTVGDGWPMSASGCATRIYINQNNHPDQLRALVAEHTFQIPDEDDFDSLRALFVDQAFDDDGELVHWHILERLREGRAVFRTS